MVNKVQFQATYLGTSEGYYKYFALEDKDADILFIVDKFILFDMVTNTHGQLSKKNVIFDYNPPQSQYYFAHRFGDYLEDSGFGIKYCKELPFEHILAKKGYGVIIGEKL